MSSESTDSAVREKLDALDRVRRLQYALWFAVLGFVVGVTYWGFGFIGFQPGVVADRRSEERRVGKECRL